ncbi:acetylcholine receptor subunit beta-like 2 [Halyomorpha halys]|uniref:acetylcholine receptor subunit beta-like 2 n=1 Tax=Halyomorpha halys TaxID=286706 RepID=UPI0006D4C993|nr:acetylcholine receptor subunit beta-like 2 [Halyomorpha halys]
MDQVSGNNLVEVGIDLTEFYLSVEWDILAVPATRNEEYYPCCKEPYSDITFNLTMRRKTLFYTVNLIIPCVGITFLTVLVFYLPSDSGEKITLCSSILVSLTVFFLLLAEIIPPTSLAVPLLGKYLLFTMGIVSFSICVTVCVLNIHFRSPSTHKMSPWVKTVFLVYMPRMLMMRRPPYSPGETFDEGYPEGGYLNDNDFRDSLSDPYPMDSKNSPHDTYETVSSAFREHVAQPSAAERENMIPRNMSPGVIQALEGVRFIAQHIKDSDKDNEVIEDWKYISMVLDRFFLWVFTLACMVGTCWIIFQAPSLYDQRIPIDQKLSEIPLRKSMYAVPADYVNVRNHPEF